jgi:DNA adenine methylase
MSYPGSKAQAGTFQRIIGQMPPHDLFVEAFAGSAEITRRMAPSPHAVLLELDPEQAARLKAQFPRADVFTANALDFLKRFQVGSGFAFPANTVVYCDPPYMLATRAGRRYYRHEFTDEQHAQLLALVKQLPCRVLISHPPCDLYLQQLQSWRCITYRTRTRGKTVTECLWANFPEPEVLHDWRFAGKGNRQRTSWKRVARRWLAKLDAMQPRKRGFILQAIEQRHFRRCELKEVLDLPAPTPALGAVPRSAPHPALRTAAPAPALGDRTAPAPALVDVL